MANGTRRLRTPLPKLKHNFESEIKTKLSDHISIKKELIKSMIINCHYHDEIENSNNIIFQCKSGANIST